MTNEEFQKLVLKEFANIRGEVSTIRGEVSTIRGEVSSIREELKPIVKRLDSLEGKVSDMQVQQQENTDLINALIHNVEVANAKIDGLALNTVSKDAIASLATKEDIANCATKEDIAKLHTKLDILTVRQTNQEVELKLLKNA